MNRLEIPSVINNQVVADWVLITSNGVAEIHCTVYKWDRDVYCELLTDFEWIKTISDCHTICTATDSGDTKMFKCWERVGLIRQPDVAGISWAKMEV